MSTPSVVLTGCPPCSDLVPEGYPARGYPIRVTPWQGPPILVQGVPWWGVGVPYLGTTSPCLDLVRGGALPGYPPYWPGWGVPWQGVPYLGTSHPDLAWGYPTWVPPWQGNPPSWPGRVPPQLDLAGYPPRCLPHGILDNVAKHYGIWVPPLAGSGWVPPPPPRCLPHGILGNVAKHYGIWVPPPPVWTN